VAALHDSVDVPDVVVELRVMLVGLSVHAGPVTGDVEEERFTVPLKLSRPLIVMVELLDDPAMAVADDGLVVIVKS
jgi:hypothetical protein